jgi:hypothetical protein
MAQWCQHFYRRLAVSKPFTYELHEGKQEITMVYEPRNRLTCELYEGKQEINKGYETLRIFKVVRRERTRVTVLGILRPPRSSALGRSKYIGGFIDISQYTCTPV